MPAVEDLDTYGAPEACSMSSSCNRRPFAGGVGAGMRSARSAAFRSILPNGAIVFSVRKIGTLL